jgi:hypothetical protein
LSFATCPACKNTIPIVHRRIVDHYQGSLDEVLRLCKGSGGET